VRRGGPDAPSPADAELAADLAQTLWVGLPGPTLTPHARRTLARGALGGIVLFARNVGATPAALAALCDELHADSAAAGPPVLVGADQEGGRVQAIRAFATRWPAMARLGAHPNAALARAAGAAIGSELAALGIDVDFAPVLDVRAPASESVIGDRAFAADTATVANLAGALADGLAAAGRLACGKHFPGHGGAQGDSHRLLPIDARPRDVLLADALAPFAALAPRLPILMGAHVAYAGLGSDRPGTLDERVATGLLRDQLGYRGVLVTDNLEMGAVTARFSIEVAAVAAMNAGCDALLLCHRHDSFARARAALWREAHASPHLRTRLSQAASRIRDLKARHFAARNASQRPPLSVIGAPSHASIAIEMAG
jgi:beta-N-acetylhexosaminidase